MFLPLLLLLLPQSCVRATYIYGAAVARGHSPSLRLRGGALANAQEEDSAEEDRLRCEYERYVAAVEMPLSNFDEARAQATQAVRIRGLLSPEEIQAVHQAGAALALQRGDSTIDRSAWGQPEGTWRVTFLNTDGAFESLLPDVYERIRRAALAVDLEYWNVTAGVRDVNYRVAEYHTMVATLNGAPTGGGLHTTRHCDQGSLVTVDILLTDPSEIEGGVLQTLEPDGELTSHTWAQGDALIFLSHKYHSVSELTRGTRQVLVCELWQGTDNLTPSRDEKERWQGVWK